MTARTLAATAVLAAALALTGCTAAGPQTMTTPEATVSIEDTGADARRLADEIQALLPQDVVESVDPGDDAASSGVAGTDQDPDGRFQQWTVGRDFYLTAGTPQLETLNSLIDALVAQGWTITDDGAAYKGQGRRVTITPSAPGGYAAEIFTDDDERYAPLIRLAVFGPVVDTQTNTVR
jgi:hypothetical protein